MLKIWSETRVGRGRNPCVMRHEVLPAGCLARGLGLSCLPPGGGFQRLHGAPSGARGRPALGGTAERPLQPGGAGSEVQGAALHDHGTLRLAL